MVVSAQENAVIEEAAKFAGYKELLEDDMEDTTPDSDVYENVRSNQSELKKQYMNLRVAQAKYKSKFVPASATEVDFNGTDSPYQYSDGWLENRKKEYQRLNKAASAFLKGEHAGDDAAVEEKVLVAATGEIQKVMAKITMESGQVESSLDETYRRLQKLENINPSQAQVYKDLKDDLMEVIDVKIPSLIKTITELAGPTEEQNLTKLNRDFAAFEDKEKTRLYRLVQIIAEKTSSPAIQSSGHGHSLQESRSSNIFWQGGGLS